jgi:hypothetical protein
LDIYQKMMDQKTASLHHLSASLEKQKKMAIKPES